MRTEFSHFPTKLSARELSLESTFSQRTRIGSDRPRHGKFIDFGSHSNLVIKQS